MAKGWIWLALTIGLESVAVLLLRLGGRSGQQWWAWMAGGLYALAFYTLHLALKQLPAALANALWAGCSAVIVAWVGWWWLGEHLTLGQWLSLGLIVAGMAGLQLFATSK